MLFHVTHKHTAQTCPADDKEKVKNTWGKVLKSADEVGVKLISAYVDAPAHTVFLVLDADSPEKLEKFFFPVLKIGHGDIRPVTDAMETVKRFS